jgi:hypothetical protein
MNVIQRKERQIEVIRFKRYRGKRKKNGIAIERKLETGRRNTR